MPKRNRNAKLIEHYSYPNARDIVRIIQENPNTALEIKCKLPSHRVEKKRSALFGIKFSDDEKNKVSAAAYENAKVGSQETADALGLSCEFYSVLTFDRDNYHFSTSTYDNYAHIYVPKDTNADVYTRYKAYQDNEKVQTQKRIDQEARANLHRRRGVASHWLSRMQNSAMEDIVQKIAMHYEECIINSYNKGLYTFQFSIEVTTVQVICSGVVSQPPLKLAFHEYGYAKLTEIGQVDAVFIIIIDAIEPILRESPYVESLSWVRGNVYGCDNEYHLFARLRKGRHKKDLREW